MYTSSIIGIGSLLMKIVFRARFDLSNNSIDSGVDIIDYIANKIDDKYAKKDYYRAVDAVSDELEKCCWSVIDNSQLSKERKSFLKETIEKALEALGDDNDFFTSTNLDYSLMKKRIEDRGSIDRDDFDENEYYILDRVLGSAVELLKELFNKMPEFAAERAYYIISNIEDLKHDVEDLSDEIYSLNRKLQSLPEMFFKYETEYRSVVNSKYNTIELFGADDLNRELRRYELSTAYVELEIRSKDSEEKLSVHDIFANNRKNIWLKGDAGSGKTTFLSWLTINSANCEESINGLEKDIPLLVKLRELDDYERISLPNLFENVMINSTYKIPEGWIEGKIEAGKILFMFDGFDEISFSDREHVFNWIKEIDPLDRCKKIFTARPQILERPDNITLTEVEMLPMTGEKIDAFIEYWHYAVLKNYQTKEDIQSYIDSLICQLRQNESLNKLSSNPLLCAMISALHFKNQKQIPSSKRDLYEACCKMLIDGRDNARHIKGQKISLSYEQKKWLVAKLASKMMENNVAETSKEDTKKMFSTTLKRMGNHNITGEELLSHLIERSGLIKEPENGKISFVHKSFQEYLCAYYLTSDDNWDCILNHIGSPEWLETITLAIGFGSEKHANEILRRTLNKGVEEGDEDTYLFYAIEYLSGVKETDPELRTIIERRIKALIPPNADNYIRVAKAGNIAVMHLKYNKNYSPDDILYSLCALEQISSGEAVDVSKTYFKAPLRLLHLRELSELYRKQDRAVLNQKKIVDELFNFIKRQQKNNLSLPYSMYSYLSDLSEKKKSELLKIGIDTINISGYSVIHESRGLYPFPGFLTSGVRKLSISGRLGKCELLPLFQNLEELTLSIVNKNFNLEELNNYQNLYDVKKWNFILCGETYINPKNLKFLANCTELGLVLHNEDIEIEYDGFKNLNRISIASETMEKIDIEELSNIPNIDIAVPKEQMDYMKYDLECYAQKYTLIEFNTFDPFHNMYSY